jgi:hypothetical protein
MTHEEIDEQNIAERYVLRTLSADESARFEEHFVDCPHCQDRLEAVERLRDALKPLAAAGAARAASSRFGPRVAWLAAATLALAAGLSFFFIVRLATTRRELEQSQIASLDWRQRYEALRRSAAPEAPILPQPLVGATYYLSTTRSAEADTSEPVNRVTVPPGLQWVILSPGGKMEPGFRSLRASLKDAAGQEVWRQSGLPAISQELLSVALPSALLHNGDYVLILEGLSPDGRYLKTGVYRLRVLKRG